MYPIKSKTIRHSQAKIQDIAGYDQEDDNING